MSFIGGIDQITIDGQFLFKSSDFDQFFTALREIA